MTTIGQKADYVRTEASRNETFDHHCHWPGCTKTVPPAMWGCKSHWFALPAALRRQIWATYQPGQEVTKDPSAAYLEVVNRVQAWIKDHGARPRGEPV